ncbi:O-antigen ligase family protein [Vibrio cholerae]
MNELETDFNRSHFSMTTYLLPNLIILPTLWALTGNFLYPDAKLHWVSITLLGACVAAFYQPITKTLKHNQCSFVGRLIIGLSLFGCVMYFTHGYSSGLLRALLCSLIIILFTPTLLVKKLSQYIPSILFASSVLSFLYTVNQTYLLSLGRWWSINPIPYTTFTTTLACICFYLIFHCQTYWQRGLLLLSVPLSLSTLFMAETRGLWVAFFIALIATLLLLIKERKLHRITLGLLIVGIAIVGYVGKEKIEQRVQTTKAEYAQIQNGNLNTSIGLRLQMWQSSIAIIKDHWLIGLGQDYRKQIKELAQQGKVTRLATTFTHVHNQFLDMMVKYGLLGLLATLALFLLPIYQALRYPSPLANAVCIMGLVYFVAGLTDVPLNHPQTIGAYFMFNFLVWARATKPTAR